MQITNELISYVASLSCVKLEESEVLEMQKQISTIVDYMDTLNELDTDGIEPLSHIFNITNVMRDDEIVASYSREDILSNAPQCNEESFIVPKVIE